MDELITRKQFAAAIFVSLLSPLLRLLPQTAVELAGRGAWLSVVPAALPLLVLGAILSSFRTCMRPGEGLGGLLLRWLGPVMGRVVLVLYAAWFLFYGGFILRSGADRLAATIYPGSGPTAFIVVTVALCLLVALGDLRAAARTAVLMRAVLVGALAAVLALSIPNMDLQRLLPIGWRDAGQIALGALPLASVGAVAGGFAFLSGYVRPAQNPRWLVLPMLTLLVLGGAICAAVVSVFGPALTHTLTYPFFIMIRSISLGDLAPRIEALVIAAWVGADFLLCAFLLRCAHEALRPVFSLPSPEGRSMFSLRGGRFLLWLEAAALLACSLALDMPPWQLRAWSDKLVPLVSDIMLYGGYVLLWLVTIPRRRQEHSLQDRE